MIYSLKFREKISHKIKNIIAGKKIRTELKSKVEKMSQKVIQVDRETDTCTSYDNCVNWISKLKYILKGRERETETDRNREKEKGVREGGGEKLKQKLKRPEIKHRQKETRIPKMMAKATWQEGIYDLCINGHQFWSKWY